MLRTEQCYSKRDVETWNSTTEFQELLFVAYRRFPQAGLQISQKRNNWKRTDML